MTLPEPTLPKVVHLPLNYAELRLVSSLAVLGFMLMLGNEEHKSVVELMEAINEHHKPEDAQAVLGKFEKMLEVIRT